MAELELSQDRLAEQIIARGEQASGAAISDLLAMKRPESKLVPHINAVLGGLPPVQYPLGYEPDIDEVQARIRDKIKGLSEDQHRLVLDLLEQLTKKD